MTYIFLQIENFTRELWEKAFVRGVNEDARFSRFYYTKVLKILKIREDTQNICCAQNLLKMRNYDFDNN